MFKFASSRTRASNLSSHDRSQSSPQPQNLTSPSPSCFDATNCTNPDTNIIPAPPRALTSILSHTAAIASLEEEFSTQHGAHGYDSLGLTAAQHQLPPFRNPQPEEYTSGAHRETVNLPSRYIQSKHTSCNSSSDTSPILSPTKDERSFLTRFNENETTNVSINIKGSKLSDWFKGESDAISIGILPSPTKEKLDSFDSMWTQSTNKLQPKTALNTPPRPSAPTTSRFPFFASKSRQPLPLSLNADDEFAHLDIKAALQPGGQADPFSPSSFKNLLQHAEGLLTRMQSAYQQRTLCLQEVVAEKDAQSEELEEAQTRARHLKIQLDDMTAKMAEQDKAMMDIVDELAMEKEARRNEEDARRRTKRVIDATMEAASPRGGHHRRPYRISRASTVSDSGFESDEGSSADSLFSKQQVTSSSATSVTTSSMNSPEIQQSSEFLPFSSKLLKEQPIMKCTNAVNRSSTSNATSIGKEQFIRCQDFQSSEAWNVVGMLTEENKELKSRIGHLESELDGCLDLVRGLGI